MASWSDLLHHIAALGANGPAINQYINGAADDALTKISTLREGRNVIFYASAFLQKPQADPMLLQITNEEINGLMAVMQGMDFSKGLTLILHTPGGVTNATESIVEYLHSKFSYVEVIVPTFAMSAGTMISLSADLIVMGKPSQLGPIDPQMIMNGRTVSAKSIVEQFEMAKNDISADVKLAHVWAPILAAMGPGLLVEAEKASDYSEKMVSNWLKKKGHANHDKIAKHFNSASVHKSHGRRIDRKEALDQGLKIEELESNQDLQEAVLTAYHAVTIIFEKSPTVKMFVSNNNKKRWIKNMQIPQGFQLPFPQGAFVPIPQPPQL